MPTGCSRILTSPSRAIRGSSRPYEFHPPPVRNSATRAKATFVLVGAFGKGDVYQSVDPENPEGRLCLFYDVPVAEELAE